MLIFPRLVYKGPAVHRLVQDEAGYDAALLEGWNGCASESVKNAAAPAKSLDSNTESAEDTKPQDVAAPFDDAPPTRDEMLAQAEKLGIDVDKRWGDKRLMAEIDKAMKG